MTSEITDFSALYQKHAPDLFRFTLYLSGNRAEAEDLTSEAFVRAWTSAEPIRAATVKGYLFTIARNLFLQGLRKKRRDVALSEEAGRQVHDPQPDPLARAEKKAEYEAVLARLLRLPEADRTALVMRAFDGLPYEEIAQALGIPLGTVKIKIHRARLALAGIRDA